MLAAVYDRGMCGGGKSPSSSPDVQSHLHGRLAYLSAIHSTLTIQNTRCVYEKGSSRRQQTYKPRGENITHEQAADQLPSRTHPASRLLRGASRVATWENHPNCLLFLGPLLCCYPGGLSAVWPLLHVEKNAPFTSFVVPKTGVQS